ncbi:MAG: winged helix-turn-helix domain-containing protein [Acidobacteriota bacterium]
MPSTSRPSSTPSPSAEADRPAPITRIGAWQVDSDGLTLVRDDETRRLEPKVMALLLFLAERAPQVVRRDALFEHVWEGKAVVDSVLSRAVSVLRQALDDDPRAPRYVETVPRKGYRLIAEVERAPSTPGDEEPEHQADEPAARRLDRRLLAALALVALSAFAVVVAQRPGDHHESPSSTAPIRIVVLPLDHLDGGPGELDVAGGLTEALIHQLSTVSALSVVSRTSGEAVDAQGLTAPEIARRLRVDYLIEGSASVVGERLRITIQLIAPARDQHLWSHTYDRTMDDVLDIQRHVAIDVAARVEAELTPSEQRRLAARGAVDGEAYRRYLQGRQHLERRNRAALDIAREHLQTAVTLDPELAVAWAALGELHLLSELYLRVPQTQAYARAQESIDRALALDAELATAHTALGQLRLIRDWDWTGAETAYRAAVRRSPSHARAHQWLSECLSLAGRHEEALRSIETAAQLDPLSPLVHAAWGQRLNAAGRYRQALERFHTADALGAGFAWHLREAAYAHERLGDLDAALDAHVERMQRRRVDDEDLAVLRRAIETDGLVGYWRWQHGRLTGGDSEPMLIAEALAGRGSTEEAIPWLRAAAAKRGTWFLHLRKSPAFDPLRDDPRFRKLADQATP